MMLKYGKDSLSELPRRCLTAPPRLAGDWYHEEWSERTGYEVLVGELLGRGIPVPGHPVACGTPGCAHAIVWHKPKTRDHPCLIEDCPCRKLDRRDIAPRTA